MVEFVVDGVVVEMVAAAAAVAIMAAVAVACTAIGRYVAENSYQSVRVHIDGILEARN